ncbi:PIN domain-containing protein [Alcanivorax sp.]|uniref:type II toxin-antitoxin system VapC family toxin n=1 Tax=Alcanivorax sp. TaxID=1872427 RepID=UPI00258A5D04|nr:PIN domain-containing protein [Alcanivorax sp.]
MKLVFVDTGGWFAALARRDQDHAAASDFLKRWRGGLVTTDYVLDETLTLIQSRIDHTTAVNFLDAIERSSTLDLVFVAPEDYYKALDLFRRRADKQWSFTDCTSFTVMARLDLSYALAFDNHFEQAGFLPAANSPI